MFFDGEQVWIHFLVSLAWLLLIPTRGHLQEILGDRDQGADAEPLFAVGCETCLRNPHGTLVSRSRMARPTDAPSLAQWSPSCVKALGGINGAGKLATPLLVVAVGSHASIYVQRLLGELLTR